MDPPNPDDYERIKPPKKGRPYPYKCRYCGAPAAWKEALTARDRRRRRVSWCICDQCYRQAVDARPDQDNKRQLTGHMEP